MAHAAREHDEGREALVSVAQAAALLGVHPNTVRYRLRRIEKLTGLDTSSFYHLVELVTALRLAPADPASPRPQSRKAS